MEDIITKQCSKCGEWKELSYFGVSKKDKSGVKPRCKQCILIDNRQYRESNREEVAQRSKKYKQSEKGRQKERKYRERKARKEAPIKEQRKQQKLQLKQDKINKTSKICIKCNIEKDKSCFSPHKETTDKLYNYCKNCEKLKSKEYKQKIKNTPKIIDAAYHKTCTICKETKHFSLFKKANDSKDGLSPNCKKCCNAQYKKYSDNNKGKIQKRNKLYSKTENRKKVLKKYAAKKLNNCPEYRMHINIRSAVYSSLKGNKAGQSTFTLLDYSFEELKAHIDKQLAPGMTYANYGKYWSIDHIIPVSYFLADITYSTDIAFRMCWALPNLRPLTVKENISKSNKLIDNYKDKLQELYIFIHNKDTA